MIPLAPLIPLTVITVSVQSFLKNGRCCFIRCMLGQHVPPLVFHITAGKNVP